MNFNNGLWLLPTKNRPKRLEQFFDAYHKTGATTAGVLIVGDNGGADSRYQDVIREMPNEWDLTTFEKTAAEPIQCLGASLRQFMSTIEWTSYDWIGLVCDDQIPVTPQWDLKIIETLNGKNFVSSNDLVQPHRMMGAVAWSVPLLKAVGYLYPPKFHHNFMDDIWESLGTRTNTWKRRLDVVVEHAHWNKNAATPGRQTAQDSTAEDTMRFFHSDRNLYTKWLANDFSKTVERIKKIL